LREAAPGRVGGSSVTLLRWLERAELVLLAPVAALVALVLLAIVTELLSRLGEARPEVQK
jgi:hypothetical protein